MKATDNYCQGAVLLGYRAISDSTNPYPELQRSVPVIELLCSKGADVSNKYTAGMLTLNCARDIKDAASKKAWWMY